MTIVTKDYFVPDQVSMGGVAGTKGSMPLSWSCTDQALLEVLKKRDPSGQGLPSVQALRLLMSLLHWNPAARPTAEQASVATPDYVECLFTALAQEICLL